MGFPGLPTHPKPSIRYNNREIVAAYLEEHHKNHYMIFNLSDETYESILFGDHVLSSLSIIIYRLFHITYLVCLLLLLE